MTQPIKLEIGKQYVLNNGEVLPCEMTVKSELTIGGMLYSEDGRLSSTYHHPAMDSAVLKSIELLSVSHEYPPQDDTPTLWCDMTPEEKGALLLAKHEGREIEIWRAGEWRPMQTGGFGNVCAYRIKPTPKVETVALCWRHDVENVKNKIGTIDLVDGKPDTASIKPDPTT